MKPKEKAKMLIEKMYNAKDPFRQYPMCFDTAKQCALIAVEEIIEILWKVRDTEIEYWNEVKAEIEKL